MKENKEQELPAEEILIRRLLSFDKYIGIHRRSKKMVRITVEFEDTRFKSKGFAFLDLSSPAENAFFQQSEMLDFLQKAADNESDRLIKERIKK